MIVHLNVPDSIILDRIRGESDLWIVESSGVRCDQRHECAQRHARRDHVAMVLGVHSSHPTVIGLDDSANALTASS